MNKDFVPRDILDIFTQTNLSYQKIESNIIILLFEGIPKLNH